jgi:hypothetical protein
MGVVSPGSRKDLPRAVRAPLLEARRQGYQVAVLHATDMGYPVNLRLGFEEVCEVGLRLRLSES